MLYFSDMARPERRRDWGRTAREVGRIAVRDAFLPINTIILAVVAALAIFGQSREAIFLGAIVVLNTALSFAQDVRAWLLLEHIQLLTTPQIMRLGDGESEEIIPLEAVAKGDRLRLMLGDQMPCDGRVEASTSLEVNEGLITGESDSSARADGDSIIAGSVVTAGSCIVVVETSFAESRMAKMARGLERYSANPSPIQRSIQEIIRVTIYILLAVSIFVAVRGYALHEAIAHIVEQIGALASVLVPQGLVVSTTLLFTYGAWHFYNRHVLLQEVNATEKFGRIRNLCMDKTGTLTENDLTVERMLVPPGGDEDAARTSAALYMRYSGDSSLSIKAIAAWLPAAPEIVPLDVLSFSSWRRYGGIALRGNEQHPQDRAVLVGGYDVFLPHIADGPVREWLTSTAEAASRDSKHILCVVEASASAVPSTIDGMSLSVVCIFELGNRLREGVRAAVDFFQDRGVTVRILSGDNPDTVQAIADAAGVRNSGALVTGAEMKNWSDADYAEKSREYTIFGRIEPEQKEKVIDALKRGGFTAMVGDGANDALSVKHADLGLAVFDGAPATRQTAAVVLMRNSFVELPAGVELAASMIENIEMFGAIFMSQTFLQFMLFLFVTLSGSDFPLSPLNVAFLNYFTVGFAGVLIASWAVNPTPRAKQPSEQSFLSRIVPFSLALSFVQAAAAMLLLGIRAYVPADELPSVLIIGITALSLVFFALAAERYISGISFLRRASVAAFGIFEAVLLTTAYEIPSVRDFFGLAVPDLRGVIIALLIAFACGYGQYLVAEIWFGKRREKTT